MTQLRKVRDRVIELRDNEGDLWQAKVDDGKLVMRYQAGNDFKPWRPVDEPCAKNYLCWATTQGLAALGELIENPTEPVPTRPREHKAKSGVRYRAMNGQIERAFPGESFYPALLSAADYRALVDLLDNPTEEVTE